LPASVSEPGAVLPSHDRSSAFERPPRNDHPITTPTRFPNDVTSTTDDNAPPLDL